MLKLFSLLIFFVSASVFAAYPDLPPPTPVSQAGRVSVGFFRNDYTSVSVTASGYRQIFSSLSDNANQINLFDSSGRTLVFALGQPGQEVNQFYIPPGGFSHPIDIAITAGARGSIKAVSGNATTGEIDMNLFN